MSSVERGRGLTPPRWLSAHGSDSRLADFARALAIYLVTRAAFALFVWLTGQHYDCGRVGCVDRAFFPDNFLLNGLFQWDAFQYRQLLERGYFLGADFDTTAPYFPVFPMFAWAAGKLVGSPLAGGIVVNHLASIAAAFGVARLCRRLNIGEENRRARVAPETTLFWLASPLTVFFCVFLSESVFGLLSVLVLWGVVTGTWAVVLVSGILITATRNAGMIVVVCAALLAWERRASVAVGTRGWVCLALTPLGLAALSLYQHHHLGDALAWVHVQIRWNRFLTTPWRTIQDDWFGWPGLRDRDVRAMYRVQELLALAVTAPLFFLRGKLNIPWAILLLGVAEWLLPTTSHSLMSSARYQAGNLYFALAIPALIADRPMLRGLCYMLFGMVIAWYLSTFPYGVWAS